MVTTPDPEELPRRPRAIVYVDGFVRHEALFDRVGVRDLRRLAVAAVG